MKGILLSNTVKYCREHLEIETDGPVDIHTHGVMGVDFTTAEPERIAEACSYYAEKGIAGIMPAVMTAPAEVMLSACRNIARAAELVKEWNEESCTKGDNVFPSEKEAREAASRRPEYAGIVGINLEGPFISPKRCGAQPADCIQEVSDAFLEECQAASGGLLRLMTVAPEMPGVLRLIDRYHGGRLHFSVGHTDCDYDTAMEAFSAGADQLTHAFNAMRGIHHREPGPVTAAIDSGAYLEMICDGIHVNSSVVSMMAKVCGERLIPISDSICPCGLPDGSYRGFVKSGREIRLVDGGLAGGGTFLTEMFPDFNYVKKAIDEIEAARN